MADSDEQIKVDIMMKKKNVLKIKIVRTLLFY